MKRKKIKKYRIKFSGKSVWNTAYCFNNPTTNILINADKIVSRAKQITVKLDYPFDNPPVFTYKRKSARWTLSDALKSVIKAYHRAYRNEAKYQVWGHYLSDLSIDSITISSGSSGCTVICEVSS